jgi:hypothetical protein
MGLCVFLRGDNILTSNSRTVGESQSLPPADCAAAPAVPRLVW